MRRNRGVGRRDQQAAGHAEVDEELRGFFIAGEVDDDSFADAVDSIDPASGERFNNRLRRGLEGLGLVAGPHGADGLALDARVNAVGYGLDFGEFGHGSVAV